MKIFQDNSNSDEIIAAIIEDGVALIEGGRMAVRDKLSEVEELMNSEKSPDELEEYPICSFSYNHPYTELGIIYDSEYFDLSIKSKAIKVYDKYLSEKGEEWVV